MYTGQHCKVQISDNNGASWSDTSFDQTGTNSGGGSPSDPGENSFVDRSVDLSAHAGKTVRIRFILDYQSGAIFGGDPNVWVTGWYIDNITFSDIEEIGSVSEVTVASGNSFLFTPPAIGTYRLSARANISGGALPYGNNTDIVVVSSDFSDWLSSHPSATGGNTGNPDSDPYINLLEYAFGLNPSDIDALPEPTITATTVTMNADRPAYDHSDLTYQIERSSTLENGSWSVVKTFGSAEDLEYTFSLTSGTQFFYRWKVTLNP